MIKTILYLKMLLLASKEFKETSSRILLIKSMTKLITNIQIKEDKQLIQQFKKETI